MQALNRHVERVFDPSRQEMKWDAASWRGINDGRRLSVRAMRRVD
jgi:hypothetical protein